MGPVSLLFFVVEDSDDAGSSEDLLSDTVDFSSRVLVVVDPIIFTSSFPDDPVKGVLVGGVSPGLPSVGPGVSETFFCGVR